MGLVFVALQAQHNMVADYARMKAMLHDERKGITQRVGVLEAGVLTQLATGDSAVLGAVLGWPSAAVETAKGAWFDAQLGGEDDKEFMLDQNVGVLRAQGFMSTEALRYRQSAEKLVRAEVMLLLAVHEMWLAGAVKWRTCDPCVGRVDRT
jgi:hypothetical protein